MLAGILARFFSIGQSVPRHGPGGLCEASENANVTVRTAYNPDGNVISITAENSVTGDQTTQYIYGTTLTDSVCASSLLIAAFVGQILFLSAFLGC